MKAGPIFIFLFLLVFIVIIFPDFYSDTVNNTLTGGEGLIIENIAIVFLVMFCAVPVLYVLVEKGRE